MRVAANVALSLLRPDRLQTGSGRVDGLVFVD